RFAVNSMLEVFCHINGFLPSDQNLGRELRPTSSATSPSLYRVDFDPVDVPALNAAGEGISRAIEAYALENQENGSIELAESVIGIYGAMCIPDNEASALQVYQTSGSDAGDLKLLNSVTDLSIRKLIPGSEPGQPATDSTTNPGVGIPTYSEGSG